MLQRKCPKCKSGIMSDLYTVRGWGKEGFYVCDSCSHSKSIYEGNTIGPYIFFILFEVVIFFLEDSISTAEYLLYGIILLFLIYSVYKAQMRDSIINSAYHILGEFKGEFTPNQNQLEALDRFKKEATPKVTMIKRIIAVFIAITYSVMLFNEEAVLSISDYVFYIFFIFGLPAWLWFVKFKD